METSRASHANVILMRVNENRNPFIYLDNMGKVMTSGAAAAKRGAGWAAALAGGIAIAAAFPVGSGARADTGAWAESAHAKARLVSAVAATAGAERLQLGLEIKLDPGWKTYWRTPGEGGMPPRFDWSGSANVAGIAIAWPAPKRFEIGGMESVGYSDHVILPLEVALAKPGEPLALRLALHYAVCREICMLVEAKLALDLPATQSGARSTNADAIAQFQARVPRPGAEHGWRVANTNRRTLCPRPGNCMDLVVVDIAAEREFTTTPQLLIEGAGYRFGMTKLKTGLGTAQLRFVAPMHALGAATTSDDLVLTLIEGERAGVFTVPAPR
jgi:suppressor for copper-sensitivity B